MPIKNIIKILIVMAFIAAALAGCGKKQVVKPSEEAVKARRAVETLREMEGSYKARDMAGVLKSVSQDYKPGYAEYQTGLRKDIELYGDVSLDIAVDRVEESGAEVRVVVHWHGSWRDRSGNSHEGRGNSVFIFTQAGDGMALADVAGDMPFGVVR